MQTLHPTPLLDGIKFGEGPRWHDGKLWFSDMRGDTVYTVDEAGQRAVVVQLPEPLHPSGLGWLPDGRLLISCIGSATLLRLDADGLTTLHEAELKALVQGLNDMVVDTQGRAYIDFSRPGPEPRGPYGGIILVTPEGEVRIVAEGMRSANGLAITPDGKTLIAAETFGARLHAFDIAPDGGLSGQRVWAELKGYRPDGICLDAEGAVWLGSVGYNTAFLRVKEGGEIADTIAVPEGRIAIAVALGGADRRTLFLLNSINDPSTGFIDTVRVEVPGAGLP